MYMYMYVHKVEARIIGIIYIERDSNLLNYLLLLIMCRQNMPIYGNITPTKLIISHTTTYDEQKQNYMN